MRLLLLLLSTLPLLCSCGPHGGDPRADDRTVPDSNWIGELRMTAGDTTVRLCGTGKRYHLTGPAMDTITQRYRYASARKGQWMKVWFSGHPLLLTRGGLADSVMYARTFQHLDASLHCDPVPDERTVGRYELMDQDPLHPRRVLLDLFPDGSVVMYSDLMDGHLPLEEQGHWGVDAEGRVNVVWPARDQTMRYTLVADRLESERNAAGLGVTLQRTGAPERMSGAFARCANWIAAVATAQGHAVKPADLQPGTALSTLFTTDAARAALAASARDTLRLDDQGIALQWKAVTTVGDAAQLMRMLRRDR